MTEGKHSKEITFQTRAPVKSLVYDTPYTRVRSESFYFGNLCHQRRLHLPLTNPNAHYNKNCCLTFRLTFLSGLHLRYQHCRGHVRHRPRVLRSQAAPEVPHAQELQRPARLVLPLPRQFLSLHSHAGEKNKEREIKSQKIQLNPFFCADDPRANLVFHRPPAGLQRQEPPLLPRETQRSHPQVRLAPKSQLELGVLPMAQEEFKVRRILLWCIIRQWWLNYTMLQGACMKGFNFLRESEQKKRWKKTQFVYGTMCK